MKPFENLGAMMEHFARHGGFLTAKDAQGRTNTMTISWGFVGNMWNKPHFITVVRPQRFTYDLLATADNFTISVPFGTMSEELKICGTQSGRDIDKSTIVTFAPAKTVTSPIVAGCDFYYECRINYVDSLHGNKIPKDVDEKFYNQDWHDFFIGEIVESYARGI